MAFDKWLKIRVGQEHLDKVEADSLELGKNASEHVRDIIVRFDIVDYRRDEEMGLIDEEE